MGSEPSSLGTGSGLAGKGTPGENPLASTGVQVLNASLLENLHVLLWIKLATLTNKPKLHT